MERQAPPWCLLILFCYYEYSMCHTFKIPQAGSEPRSPLSCIPQRSGSTMQLSQDLSPFYWQSQGRLKGLSFGQLLAEERDANFLWFQVPSISPCSFLAALPVGLKEMSPSCTWSEWANVVVLPAKPTAHYLYAFPASLCGLGWVRRSGSKGVKIPGQAWPQFSKCTKHLTAYIIFMPGTKLGQHHKISKVSIWNVL